MTIIELLEQLAYEIQMPKSLNPAVSHLSDSAYKNAILENNSTALKELMTLEKFFANTMTVTRY
jgi:hypothetical protein